MKAEKRVLLLLVLAALFLFHPFWLRGRVFVPGDFLYFIYPWKAEHQRPVHNLELLDVAVFFYPNDVFLNRSLQAGDFPLWNPHLFSGHPMMASGQSALFYPPKLLAHALFPTAVARTVLLLVHTLAAGVFALWWLRGRGFGNTAAGVGALVMMLNGWMMSWLEFEHVPVVFAFLPLMLMSVDRGLESGRARWWALLAVAGALSLHGAHLQYNLYSGLTVGIYAAVRILATGAWKKVPALLATTVATLALAAPTLAPVLELNRMAQRLTFSWADLGHQTASLGSILLTLLNPDILGNPGRGFMVNRCGANLLFSEFACYVGFLPLALSIYAAFRLKQDSPLPRGERAFWLGLAVASLLFAAATPVYYPLYSAFPLLQKLVPGRFLQVFVVCASILASVGAEHFMRQPEDRWLLRGLGTAGGAWLLLLGLGAFGLLAQPAATMDWLAQAGFVRPGLIKIPPVDPGPEYTALLLERLRANYLWNPQMFAPIAAAAGIWLAAGRRRWRGPILLAVTAVDLLIFGTVYNTHMPAAELFAPTAATRFLQSEPGFFRVEKRNAAFYNTLEPYGLYLVSGYESFFPRRYLETLRRVQPGSKVNMRSIALVNLDSPILDSLNVRYAVLPPMDELQSPRWELVFEDGARIYRNRQALERAYVVGEARTFKNFAQATAFMGSSEFRPEREAVLELPLPQEIRPQAAGSPVRWVSYRPCRIALEVSMTAPGLLVVAEHYYPGWECRVDGQPAPVYPVNGVSRGVFLPPGQHRVQFDFRPRPLRLGLIACGIGALALLALVGWDELARNRPALQI
ncbi:MAG: YfhO family protein [Armatimonadetes bacterium]|nr:YfhO family protein [Armatimonadota bacterium]